MIDVMVSSLSPKENIEDMTTMTNSVTDHLMKLIDKEYFIIRYQRVNYKCKFEDPEWVELERKINTYIKNNLQTKMTMKAQQVKLTINVGRIERPCQIFQRDRSRVEEQPVGGDSHQNQ